MSRPKSRRGYAKFCCFEVKDFAYYNLQNAGLGKGNVVVIIAKTGSCFEILLP
jgi:hypothetical protein